jgi:hypothetical protein
VKRRTIAEIAVDLRKRLGHTQQSWAGVMGWGISTAVRFEHGAQPSPRMLAQMLEAAHANGLDDLAAEIQAHLNVRLGPTFPITPDEAERYFVAIARRIFQNKKRHAAFLKFAQPEIEILRAELAEHDAAAERALKTLRDDATEQMRKYKERAAAKRPRRETK